MVGSLGFLRRLTYRSAARPLLARRVHAVVSCVGSF